MIKYLLLFCFTLYACNSATKKEEAVHVKKKKPTADDDADDDNTTKIETNSKADILNNIIVHEEGGVKVTRAFLSFEDGRMVPKGNRTSLHKAVYLSLVIDKGWNVEDGKVAIDAAERITTGDGELVLDAPNLFKSMPLLDEAKSRYIYLKATINKTRPDIDYFIIHYRVWDKGGNVEISGSYRLYIDTTNETTE